MANESKTVSEKKEQKSGTAIKKLIPFLGLIGLFIIFAATTNGKFLTATNLTNIISQVSLWRMTTWIFLLVEPAHYVR